MTTKSKIVELQPQDVFGFWNDENNTPLYNPGRDDEVSWDNPQATVPPDMVGGYDVSKGAVVAVAMKDAPKVFAALVKAAKDSGQSYPKFWEKIVKSKTPGKLALEQRAALIKRLAENPDEKCDYLVSGETDDADDVSYSVTNKMVADTLSKVSNRQPAYFILCGQRRAYSLGWVLALREAMGIKNPLNYAYVADVRNAAEMTGQQIHEMVLRENAENAKAHYSDVGKLRNAIALRAEQPRIGETDMGRLLGLSDGQKSLRGLRQKIHRWARLAVKFPELEISDRVGKPADVYPESNRAKAGQVKYVKGGSLPVRKLDKEDAAALLGDKEAKKQPTVAAIYGSVEDGEKREATPAEIEKYFAAVVTGSKPPVISRKDMKAWRETGEIANHRCQVKEVLKAIEDNDFEFFEKLANTE